MTERTIQTLSPDRSDPPGFSSCYEVRLSHRELEASLGGAFHGAPPARPSRGTWSCSPVHTVSIVDCHS